MRRGNEGNHPNNLGTDNSGASVAVPSLLSNFAGIVDKRGKLQFATEAPFTELGYANNEALGKPFWEIGWFSASPQAQQIVKDSVAKALKGETVKCEIEAFTKDGNSVPAIFNMGPLKGREGDIVSIVAQPKLVPASIATSVDNPEAKLKFVLDNIQEVFYRADGNGDILSASPAAKDMFDLDSEEHLLNKNIEDIWTDSEQTRRCMKELMTRGKVEDCEIMLTGADGAPVIVEATAHLLFDSRGEVSGSEWIVRDIVSNNGSKEELDKAYADIEKVKAEIDQRIEERAQTLKEIEGRYSTLVEWTSDGIVIVQDRLIIFANSRFAEMTGYDVYELEGIEFTETLTPESEESVRGWYRGMSAGTMLPDYHQADILKKDGDILQSQANIISIEYDGRHAQMIVLQGHSAQISSEITSVEPHNICSAIVDNANDAICVVKNHKCVFANQKWYEMVGYTRDEMEDISVPEQIASPRSLDNMIQNHEFQMAGEDVPPVYQMELIGADGRIIPAEISGNRIEYEGELADIIIVRNISDRASLPVEELNYQEQISSISGVTREVSYKMDEIGNFTWLSSSAATVFGYESSVDMQEVNFEELWVYPDERTSFMVELDTMGQVAAFEATFMKEDGTHVIIEIKASLIFNDGETAGSEGVFTDITNRKNVEEEFGTTHIDFASANAQVETILREKDELLREVEARNADLIERAADGIVILQDGIIRSVNGKIIDIVGCSREELEGQVSIDLLAPHAADILWKNFQRRLAGEKIESIYETELQDKDGRAVSVELNCGLVDYEGKPADMVIIRDISERKKEEASHKASQYSLVVEKGNDGVVIVDKDVNVLFANQRLYELCGYTPEDIEEAQSQEGGVTGLFVRAISASGPEKTQEVLERFERRMSGKDVAHISELQIRRKNGTCLPVELNITAIEYEGITANLILISDISERFLAEEKLRENERRYQAIFNNPLQLVTVNDLDGYFIEANDQCLEMLEYSLEELKSLTLQDIVYQEDLPNTIGEIASLPTEGSMSVLEAQFVTKYGRLIWINIIAVPLEHNGEVYGFLNFAENITERKQAENALQYRTEFEKLIADLSTQFTSLATDEVDEEIHHALQIIGEFSAVDRSYIMLFSKDGNALSNTHEWCAGGIEPQAANLQGLSIDEVSWFKEIDRDQAMHLSSVANMTTAASVEKELLESQDIQSIVLVPMIYGKSTVGFLGFDMVHSEKVWEEEDITLLKTISGIIVSALERKWAEENLGVSEGKFRSIFENMVEMYWCATVDGTIIDINPAGLDLLGYETQEDIVGKNFFEELSVDPDQIKSLVTERKETALYNDGLAGSGEIWLKTKDGHPIVIESSPRLIFNDDGAVIAMEGLANNVTDRNQAEDRLRQSEEKFRSVFENMLDVYYRVDTEGNIQLASPSAAELFGVDEVESVVGNNIRSLESFVSSEVVATHLDEVLEQEKVSGFETVMYKRDGTPVIVEVCSRTIRGDNGSVVSIEGMIRDITERKQSEEDIKESERRLKEIVEKLRLSQEEISTPVVQIWDRILALPLIGVVDANRAQKTTEILLNKIIDTQSELVILDVTGVATMDTEVTNHLLKTIQSTALLGADCVVTGIKPEVAQTMVHLGLDIRKLVTKRDMQEGLRWGLSKIGYTLSRNQNGEEQVIQNVPTEAESDQQPLFDSQVVA